MEDARHQVIAARWADVRSAYWALWDYRFKKIEVTYKSAGDVFWDLNTNDGVIVEMDPEGPAVKSGVQCGHVVTNVEPCSAQVTVISREEFPKDLLIRIAVFLGRPSGWQDLNLGNRPYTPGHLAEMLMELGRLTH